jgi:hypothetical protein
MSQTFSEPLADRYSRLDSPALKAIVEAPEGEYLPEAVEAARAELARRAQSGEPEELPEAPPPRSRAVTFFAIFMIFAGWSLIFQGALGLVSFLSSLAWEQALWGTLMLLAGLSFTYAASAIDEAFWGHLVKVYAIFGFVGVWNAGQHLVTGKTRDGGDLIDALQGVLMIGFAFAVYIWRRRRT